MNRPALRCSMCTGSNLTPPTRFGQQSRNQTVELVFQGEESWASSGQKGVAVKLACACLDCGYVMLLLDDAKLAELRSALPSIRPMGPDTD